MSYRTLTVREFARLTTSAVPTTLDQAQVTDADFEWLCEISARMRTQAGAHILHIDGRRWLRLDNYVGVLESPGGLRIEILPKHVERTDSETVQRARVLLRRMLEASMNLTPREGGEAALDQFDHPLTEWVMRQFLLALEYVVKRGMRSDYLRIEEEQRYLRGQLDMAKQARASPARADLFNIRHNVFSTDRAENRLLKSGLQRVSKSSRDADNWRLANELLHVLKEVPASQNVQADFRAWRTDRLITHYLRVKPWCQIVLGDQMRIVCQQALVKVLRRRERGLITEEHVEKSESVHMTPENQKAERERRRQHEPDGPPDPGPEDGRDDHSERRKARAVLPQHRLDDVACYHVGHSEQRHRPEQHRPARSDGSSESHRKQRRDPRTHVGNETQQHGQQPEQQCPRHTHHGEPDRHDNAHTEIDPELCQKIAAQASRDFVQRGRGAMQIA